MEAAILSEVTHLGSSQVDVQARAAAALSMAASRDDCPAVITDAMPQLLKTLGSAKDLTVLSNTVAAITAISSATEAGWRAAVEGGAAGVVVAALEEVPVSSSGGQGDALSINLTEAIAAIAGGGEQGLDALVAAGGAEAVVGRLSEGASAHVQEAFADSVCALAAPGGAARARLAATGAVERLATLLSSHHPEITVRVLLALGMLMGGDPAAQLRLAASPGAVERLVQLMRADDGDSKVVASGLFKGLAANQECRAAVEGALRGMSQGGGAAGAEGGGGDAYL